MPEETVTTPVEANPPAAVTPQAAPKPEAPAEVREQPDYEAAYKGLQRTVNKLHSRNEDLQRQNAEIADSLKAVRETTNLLATQNLGPEQVKALEARQVAAAERAAALRASQTQEDFVKAQTGIFIDALKTAGIDPADPEIDWGRDARDLQEWQERFGSSVTKKLEKAIASRISQAEAGIKARTAAEIKAEAEALAARAVKEAGIDKVDTGKGGGTSKKSVADMTDEEFAQYSEAKRLSREQRRTASYR